MLNLDRQKFLLIQMNVGCYFQISIQGGFFFFFSREDFKVPCKYLINIQDRFVTGKKPFFCSSRRRWPSQMLFKYTLYSTHSRLSRRSFSVITEQASELPVEGKHHYATS